MTVRQLYLTWKPQEHRMYENHNAYPELLYAIAADRVREMRAGQYSS